ncbi:MAG: hypothetical protein ACTIJ9_01105 [Aequorivita sp.]
MFKKLFILCSLFVSLVASAQDLNEIRSQYREAVSSSETNIKLNEELSNVSSANNPTLSAYKGAALTLKAKYSKSKKEKKEFFKEGVSLIEEAVKADASNLEVRYLRLSVQENSPKFLGYHKNIEEDKELILDNYTKLSSNELKEIIKDYVLKSDGFDENEKSEFKSF